MSEIIIPGATWQATPGTGAQYLVPGETWVEDQPAPTPPVTTSGNFLLMFD